MKTTGIILIFWLIILPIQAERGGCFKPYKLKYNTRNEKHESFSFSQKNVNQSKNKPSGVESEPLGCISFGTTIFEGYYLLYSFENKLTNTFYLDNDIGVNYYKVSGYDPNDIYNKYPQYYSGNVLGIHASVNPRWNFTQNYRAKKGLNTRFNSGEFIGLKTSLTYFSRFKISQTVYSIAPIIGIRRTFIDRGLIEMSVGLAYTNREIIDQNFSSAYQAFFVPELNIRVGCLLYK